MEEKDIIQNGEKLLRRNLKLKRNKRLADKEAIAKLKPNESKRIIKQTMITQ